MKELTRKQKIEFIEHAIDIINMHQTYAICIIYMDWRGSCWTSDSDNIMSFEFPELMEAIYDAKKKKGNACSLYISYSYKYRYIGRIKLLNRVRKTL